MSNFIRTIYWGTKILVNSNSVLFIIVLSIIEQLLQNPFSLSITTISLFVTFNILTLFFIMCGRLTSLFERRQIEPFLNYPGETWRLYPAIFIPYIILSTVIAFTLILSSITIYVLHLILLLSIYSIGTVLFVSSLSLITKNSTINMLVISFIYLIPPLYLLSSGAGGKLPYTTVAIGSVSPFTALVLYPTHATEISLVAIMFLSVSAVLLLSVVFSIRFLDVI